MYVNFSNSLEIPTTTRLNEIKLTLLVIVYLSTQIYAQQ